MVFTEIQAKLLIAFYHSPDYSLRYSDFAKENELKNYEVCRIGEALSEIGLIDRSNQRKLTLTSSGIEEAEEILAKIETATAHLNYENVNAPDIPDIALGMAVRFPNTLFDAMERIDQHYKIKSLFEADTPFTGQQLSRRIKEGFYILPIKFYKLEFNSHTPHSHLAMANRAFKRNCEMRIHNGRGYIVIFPQTLSSERSGDQKLITGKPDNFMYWNGNCYVPMQTENDAYKIPMDCFEFSYTGDEVASRVLEGNIEISATCSNSGMIDKDGNPVNMRAMLSVILH